MFLFRQVENEGNISIIRRKRELPGMDDVMADSYAVRAKTGRPREVDGSRCKAHDEWTTRWIRNICYCKRKKKEDKL